MAIRNTVTEFGSVAKFFHWVIALLVICMIILGFSMADLQSGSFKSLLYSIHKSCGLTVLFLLVLRYLWRLTSIKPKYPAGTPVWQAKAAKWSHATLYILLFIQTLVGWIGSTAAGHAPSFWWIVNIPAPWVTTDATLVSICFFIHKYCAWLLVGVIGLHTLGALTHWWFRRDGVFQRMQPNFTKRKKRFYEE